MLNPRTSKNDPNFRAKASVLGEILIILAEGMQTTCQALTKSAIKP